MAPHRFNTRDKDPAVLMGTMDPEWTICGHWPAECPHGCDRALATAIITAPEARDSRLAGKLDAVAGRVLGTE